MAESYEVLSERGYTSIIYLLPGDPSKVCKAFIPNCVKTHFPVERAVYERFMAHEYPSSILKYYGIHENIASGMVLEHAENLDLFCYIRHQKETKTVEKELLYRWAQQASEALEFAHSLDVFNSDIHCLNFFLDRDLNLKIGDWAGASIDGSRSKSAYRLRHRLLDADGIDVPRATGITPATEIFALGTALYFMVARHDVWPELREPRDREEIKKRIREKSFPDMSGLPVLADVIRKCWHVDFTSMTEVRHAIEAESQLYGSNTAGQPNATN